MKRICVYVCVQVNNHNRSEMTIKPRHFSTQTTKGSFLASLNFDKFTAFQLNTRVFKGFQMFMFGHMKNTHHNTLCKQQNISIKLV